MALLNVDTAISQIVQASTDADGLTRPFVFIVGAGIATPSVPLSREIVEHCRAQAAHFGRNDDPKTAASIDRYSHWFEQAYPNARQRQRYLRSLIEGKPISPASLRLAHVLIDGRVANAVVTPNFDDFVSRALTLFGKQHVICDHPGTVERIDPESNDIQIVHVHGSYWFYDCCNLREEIEGRAEASSQTMTMASLLDALLARRAPIVIGYAGWEGDVIMGALRRRLGRALPYNLYWFCHRPDEVEALPEWLRAHAQVRFVVGPKEETRRASGADDRSRRLGESRVIGDGVRDRGLTGQRIVERMIEGLQLEAPELTRDPLVFFARSLRTTLYVGSGDDTDADIYAIGEVIERIELAARSNGTPDSGAEAPVAADALTPPEGTTRATVTVGAVRNALRRSKHRDAITLGRALLEESLSGKEMFTLMEAMWTAATGLLDDSEDELDGYRAVVTLGNRLLQQNVKRHQTEPRIARALVNQGLTLEALNRGDAAVGVYDEVVRRFGDSTNPVLGREVAYALNSQSLLLSDHSAALLCSTEVVRRFGDSTRRDMREAVATALANKCVDLFVLARYEEGFATSEELCRRYAKAQEPYIRQRVAQTLCSTAFALEKLGRDDQALDTYAKIVRRFGRAVEPDVRAEVAKALVGKGGLLAQAGNDQADEKALLTFDDVLRRFGGSTSTTIRTQIVSALLYRAFTLEGLHRDDEALAAYDELLRRFAGETEPDIVEQVASALLNKGLMLSGLHRDKDALAAYEEVVRRYGDATDQRMREHVAESFVGKGSILGRLSRMDDAIAAYDEVVHRFAEDTDDDVREVVARALLSRGDAFKKLKRNAKAAQSYAELVRRFAPSTHPDVQAHVRAAVRRRRSLAKPRRRRKASAP